MYVTREIEKDIYKWIGEREIIAIIGPRQSGKTTLLLHIKGHIIEKKIFDEEHVVYITLDDEMERLKFQEDPKEYMEARFIDEKKHLFLFDEVQYLEKAGDVLKILFDKYHKNAKFIITGSCSLDIRNIGASLVGRILFFELFPFSFAEFLLAKNKHLYKYYLRNKFNFSIRYPTKKLLLIDELNKLLKEYITYGGFPRIALMRNKGKKEILLRELVTMYIEKDILKLYGQTFRNDALRVLKYLSFYCGHMLNFEELSSHLSIELKKVNEIINILENTFIIHLVRPFYKSMVTELRKKPKVYFIDNGVRNVLAEDFIFSLEKGFLFENFVFSQLVRKQKPVKYWRTTSKAEVDLIFNDIPIEVKSTPRVTRAFKSFISSYSPQMALIVNFKNIDKLKISDTVVFYMPACLF